MKKVLLLAGLLTVAAVAAGNNQYSYQNQQRSYDQAKGNGEKKQYRYRKGEENGNGQKNQYRYGQNDGKGGQGGGMHRGGKH
jgi:predicted lipid-binding transport protein (Tim44 family)